MVTYSLIAAISPDFIIGNGIKIPWYIPEDFQLFKERTTNSVVVMGKVTWDSLPIKPLPNRINIVLNKDKIEVEGAIVCTSLDAAFEEASKHNREIFIIGGASIYSQTISKAKYLYISHVKKKVEGDVFFPKFNKQDYKIVEEKEYDEFTFRKYEKIPKN